METNEMGTFTVKEATEFFHSYEMKCDEKDVEEWMNDPYTKRKIQNCKHVDEGDLYDFSEWLRWKGTAYEYGIDDQTKIARLLKEIDGLKDQIEALEKEKESLEDQLGIMPF